jgi:type II secretory pathway component PulJ
MTRRGGYSLFEMLVVMAAASTVLTISAVLIHRTMHLAAQTRAFHAEEATAWRLSAQLRNDAAGAASFDLETEDAAITVTLLDADGEPVVYRFNGPQVERMQRLDTDREARESFELPSVADWTASWVEQPVTVRLTARPSVSPTRSPAPVPISLLVRAAGEALQ